MKTMYGTIILPCTCKHEFQDERYGKGMRIHNPCEPKVKPERCRCTVCVAERNQ